MQVTHESIVMSDRMAHHNYLLVVGKKPRVKLLHVSGRVRQAMRLFMSHLLRWLLLRHSAIQQIAWSYVHTADKQCVSRSQKLHLPADPRFASWHSQAVA